MKMKRLVSLIMCLALAVSMLVGCGNGTGSVAEGGNSDYAFNEIANTVADSSDLPDWTGKKLTLKYWYATGNVAANRSKSSKKDVVTPEIYRITGVRYSHEDSFDNGGETMDARIAKILSSKDWPDIVFEPTRAVLNKMIEADMVYDLTDYIEKYCPNISESAKKSGRDYLKSDRADGRRYTIPVSISLEYSEPELETTLMARVIQPTDPYDYVYVRDDILTTIYPEAKTQDEIVELYMKNGEFTKEEIFDVPIESKEQFFEFLQKIKDLNLKEGNYDVYPTYVADGNDNWSLLANFGSLYGYSMGKSNGANYFTYWDKETKQVEYMFKQPVFKEAMKDWTGLVQKNIAARESLVDTRANFEQKIYNGVYGVLYGATLPDLNQINSTLESVGKPYKYRKVYLNIPFDNDKYLVRSSNPAGGNIAILKSQITEDDLPQVLRFIDFAHSEAGQKLAYWGPRSAGLWEEKDGKRTFVDKEVEACLVYGSANEKDIEYGLKNSAWPGYPFMSGSRYNPKLVYDMERKETTANSYFSSGMVEAPEKITAVAPDLWNFDNYINNVKDFWMSRQAFEDAVKKVFISKDDAEFEKLFSEAVELAVDAGLTDETLEEINKVYVETVNAEFIENLK